MKLLLSSLLLALTLDVSAQLSAAETRGLEEALAVGNLTLADLGYDKWAYEDRYTLEITKRALADPLAAAERLMRLHSGAPGVALSQTLRHLSRDFLGDTVPAPLDIDVPRTGRIPREVPAEIHPLLERLAAAVVRANGYVRRAVGDLSSEEQRALIESLPFWAVQQPDIEFSFSTASKLNSLEIHALLAKCDLRNMREGAAELASTVETVLPALRAAARTARFEGKYKFNLYGVTIVVAGVGNDLHDDRDAALTIDFGGNDRYTGRHGAGAGYASLAIDLGGDDIYSVADLSVGAGLLGIGLSYAIGGHDVFRGRSLTFGAGLAGVGALVKEGGHDVYEGVALTQGFGQFGIGLCIDTAGDDRYSARLYAQGAARTGGVGWLVDHRGNDFYRCGWLALALPFASGAHLSFGQGYGGGYPDDLPTAAGGVGLLTDLAGDDAYSAGVHAQAAADWLSTGSLYDQDGDDTYAAHHASQASARRGSGAFLFDLGGSDLYSVRVGASQGAGHDFAVALLLDRSGSDVYSPHDGLAGTGSANGLGLLVDGGGQDRFPAMAGVGHPARGLPSLGVFVALGSQNQYGGTAESSFARRRSGLGLAANLDADTLQQVEPAPRVDLPASGSIPAPTARDLERLLRDASLWQGADSAAAEARLIGIGRPALEWMSERRLKGATPRERRVMAAVARSLGSEAALVLGPRIQSDSVDEARNALAILIDADIQETTLYILGAFDRPELRGLAAKAAALMPNLDLVPKLMILAGGDNALDAALALTSLAAMGDPQSYSTGEALLGAPDLLVRSAALALVTAFPDRALATGAGMIREMDERRVRVGIHLLASLCIEEAVGLIAPLLRDTRAGVRMEAAICLEGRVPHEHRDAFMALLRDPVPLVRAVAARLDAGR